MLFSFIWMQQGVAQCVLAITKQPVGATKCVGDTYSFSVTNTGLGTYQWQKDGVNLIDEAGTISGATTRQLTLTDLCATCDPGDYVLVLTGTGACQGQTARSNAARLTVNSPAAITTQPTNQQACESSIATFTVRTSGIVSGYQWFRNGEPINGATNRDYLVRVNNTLNGNTYKVNVTSSCGTVTSSEATMGVTPKPAITLQPVGATECVGDDYTFTVTATNAGGYQWQKDNVDLADVPDRIDGSTTNQLTLTNLCATCDPGSYVLEVEGIDACAATVIRTTAAALLVNEPATITAQPTPQQVCEGSTATFVVEVDGEATGYQWYRNGTAIAGATSAIYEFTTSNSNDNDKFKVDVLSSCGPVTSDEVMLKVTAKPTVTLQPVGATKCVGDNYTFTVTATNAGGYQWLKDGVDLIDEAGNISGSTTNQLTLTNLCATCDPGSYVLEVDGVDACDATVISTSVAVLVVNTPVTITSQPAPQQVCEGSTATFAVQANGMVTGYKWYRNGTAVSGATSASYELTANTANNGDKFKVDVIGSCGTVTSAEVALTVNAKPVVTLQPVGATRCVSENYSFTAIVTGDATYQWQKDGTVLADEAGNISGSTTARLTLTDLCATCDPGSYVLVVTGAGSCNATELRTNAAVLVVNTPVMINTQPIATTVCEGSNALFAVQAAGTITGYQWYRNGVAISGATNSSYQLTTSIGNNGDKFKVDVIGSCGTVTSAEVALTVNAKPVITLQPVGATKCVGDDYTFTVTAINAGSYQWQKDGADITGATSANLLLSALQTGNAGTYRVRVSGAATCNAESLVSNEVVLVINTPVTISAHPQATTVCEGSNATFSVQANGSITGYQWYRNGTAISGATSASHQLTSSIANNNDKFRVDVIGSCGTVASSEVTLSVNAKPVITAQPMGVTKCVGEAYTFSVAGTAIGAYQWQKDGADIAGATSANLVLANLQTGNAGTYRVRITGAATCNNESLVSNEVTLVINTPVTITTQPTVQQVCEGSNATFSVQATGSITGYQWFRNGTAINGATSASYQLTTSVANNGEQYKVDVVGPCGTLTSNQVTLTVSTKPVITLQPVGATKCVGDNYSFTATVTGDATYQWQKDGTVLADEAGNISGATTARLTLTDLCATCDPGSYVLVVTGAGSCNATQLRTNAAVLVVNTPVAISTQPQAITVCEGGNATFTVQASGTVNGYQWYRNGSAIAGATSASYQLTSSLINHNDKYKVEVQGSCGNLTSTEVTLSVNAKPVITAQPVGATKCVGEGYTLSVSGTNVGSYQWQKDGNDIAGATSAELLLNPLSLASAGSYRVRLSGAATCAVESLLSNQVVLQVNTPVTISSQPVTTTVCEGSLATFTIQASGTITGYQWYRNGVAINGATSASYQLTTGNANDNDKFKVDVIGSCGTVTSNEITLGVNAKPVITAQPVGTIKCVGEAYTFTISGTSIGSYQWQKDGVDIAGATSANLVLGAIQIANAGTYRVRISGAGTCNSESLVSSEAVLVINTPVTISAQPQATTICEGSNATFSVQANGTITDYQWYRNGVAISGATSSSYQFTASTANNDEKYKVDVIGSCGTATSSEVALGINAKPLITAQPVGATKCVGEAYTFTVTGTSIGSYQWQKDGADIAGATSANLVLTNLQTGNAGTYRVRITGAATCNNELLVSNEVTLVINTPVIISAQPQATTVCEGSNATFALQANGTITGYQWYRNGTALPGANSASYQLTTSNTANSDDKYKVEVQGPCGNVTSNEVVLTVNAKPVLTAQPVGTIKCVGEAYTFAVTAGNVGSYQWQKDGNDIAGATAATLVLTNLQTGNAGTYRVRITGAGTCNAESLVSNQAVLVVNTPVTINSQPQGTTVCEGSTATFTVEASGTITGYQWYRNGTAISGATSSSYQLLTSTANNDDKFKVDIIGSCGTVTSNDIALGINAKPVITAQPVGSTKCVGEAYTFTVTGTSIGSYQWQKDGADIAGATSANLILSALQTANAGTYRVRITGAATCANESLVSSEVVLIVNTPVTISTQPQATTVCEGSNATFAVQANGTITGYQWYRNGVAINGATSASYQLTTGNANDNDKFKVDVIGSCGTVTSNEITLGVNAKPVITAQPVGSVKCVGEAYTFTISGTSIGPYQWQKDGVDIAGATSANLVLGAIQIANAGTYRVRIGGAATCNAELLVSSEAVLVINTPVTISAQPQATTICEGSNATFSVQANGTITGYQWYRNGTAIPGATSASYQLTASNANNNEQYRVDMQGPCGTVTSIEVSLTVDAKPVFTTQPVGAAKCVGEGYTFSVTASGTITGYQWQRNGVDIAGATAATYTIAAIQSGNAGTYRVALTGAATCGNERLTSAGATLVVNVPILITAPLVSQTICEGSPVTFAPSATGTITGYRWYRNGQLLNTTDPTYTLTATLANQNDTYRVELIGPCGTVSSTEATLAVIRIETPTITTNKPDGMCVGEQSTLTASGCTGTVTWFRDGNAVGSGNTFTTGETGTYTASCANQGCALQPRSNAVQVIQLSPLTVAATVQNVTCFAGSNGSVTITAAGAAGGPYTVRWTNPAGLTSSTAENLATGTYAFTITDRVGCTASGSQVVTQPTQPSGSIVATDVTCNGQKDGRLVLNARSDYGGYTYSVNGGTPIAFSGGATQTLTNLEPGTYTIRITDARSCDVLAATPVTINQPSALTVLAGLVKQPLSADSKDGSVEISTLGGTGPYTVRWYDASGAELTTPVQTTITATGVISRLSPVDGGVYRVVVSDKNGCEQTRTQTLVAPPRLVATITTTPISCFGRNDGTATVSVTGGVAFTATPAYRIGWRRQGTTTTIGEGLTITGLAPGTYEATITDANGISTSATASLTEPALLKTTASQILPNYCTNLPLGEVTLQTEGGRAPYRITWNGNAVTGNTVTRLPGGRQTFTVTDASGCVATTEAIVPDNATAFSTSIAYTAPTCFGRCDGTLISTVQGGNAPYQYSWRNLSVTTPTALSVCGTGETALTIQDAKGCVITSAVVSLTAPAPRVLGLPATQEVCPSKPFELSAASLTWGKTFVWTLPNSTTQTGATIQASGVGTYQITVLDENSCGGQGSILVRQFSTVNQLFTMPSEAVAGKSVVAIDLTSPAPISIRWELPGGTIVSQDTYQAKFSFAQEGTFSVTEIATVANCDYRLTKAIDIKASLDDNGFPRPMNAAPIEVTVMSNPTVGTTLKLAIANPADEDFSVTVQPITGHQRVFGQEYSKHGSNPLTINLPATVTDGLYILTVQTATVRITKHILVTR
ncbi:hypothetical protein [Fibrella aquatica]|uniref:hypothetical protein n=1 Tax=Fibrella aquatica TaxID=3242487 RepID=UPI0035231048